MQKRKTLTQKDFAWIHWTPAFIKKRSREIVQKIAADYERIKAISKNERTFDNTMRDYRIQQEFQDWGYISFLMYVSTKQAVRDAAQEAVVYMGQESINWLYDPEIYRALREYNSVKGKEKLASDDLKLLKDTLRSYRRRGFDLSIDKQRQLKKVKKEIQKLENAFSKNLNEYHDELLLTREELDGLSDDFIRGLQKKKGRYVITLEYPVLRPVLKSAHSPEVRKKLYEMNEKKGGRANLRLITKIVALRQEAAVLLGYKNHAEYVLEENMAKTPAKVRAFLEQIDAPVITGAKKELKYIQGLKKADGYADKVQMHDLKYYYERGLQKEFGLDEKELRQYFPLEHVMQSMFALFGDLFACSFHKAPITLWHKDVLMYHVKNKKGQIIGHCAFDLFPRKGKYGHMACWNLLPGHDVFSHKKVQRQNALSVIVGNFSKPSSGRPALLGWYEVQTMFHEFGHMLHGVLSEARYVGQSGTSVADDFVELPSQFAENWCWEPAYLKQLSRHYKTGKSLSVDVIEKLVDSRTFLTILGERHARVQANTWLDFIVHTKKNVSDISGLYRQMCKKYYAGIEAPKNTLFPAGFGHIGGGYDARYYVYNWALVYAYDCYSRFQKEGIFNKNVGRQFAREILAVGSSRSEMDSLKKFLGRSPRPGAFLKTLESSQ